MGEPDTLPGETQYFQYPKHNDIIFIDDLKKGSGMGSDPFSSHIRFKAFDLLKTQLLRFPVFNLFKTVKTNTSHQISLKTKVTPRKIFKEES